MKKRFKKIYIEITNICNMACSFCPKSNRAPGSMTPEQFEHVLRQIKPFTDYIYLHVKGEPLIHPDIGRFLEMSYEQGFRVNITTNGTLIDQVKRDLIGQPALRQINFSLHSVVDLNEGMDSGSDRLSAENYLNQILNFIEEAKAQSDVIVSMRLWNLEKDSIGDEPYMRDGNRTMLRTIEDAFSLQYKIDEVPMQSRGIKLREGVYLNQDYEFEWPDLQRTEEMDSGFCYGLKDQAAILVDGSVLPCCLDGEGVIRLGNIYQQPFAEIIESDRAKQILQGFAQRHAAEELCRKCGYRSRFS